MNLNPRNWEWPVEMLDDGLEFPIMFSAIFLALGWIPAFLVAALVSLATPSGAVFWTVWAVTYFFVTTTMLWLILLSRYRGVACDAVRYMREYRALLRFPSLTVKSSSRLILRRCFTTIRI
jgi:hypothetical protein